MLPMVVPKPPGYTPFGLKTMSKNHPLVTPHNIAGSRAKVGQALMNCYSSQ